MSAHGCVRIGESLFLFFACFYFLCLPTGSFKTETNAANISTILQKLWVTTWNVNVPVCTLFPFFLFFFLVFSIHVSSYKLKSSEISVLEHFDLFFLGNFEPPPLLRLQQNFLLSHFTHSGVCYNDRHQASGPPLAVNNQARCLGIDDTAADDAVWAKILHQHFFIEIVKLSQFHWYCVRACVCLLDICAARY